jgi:hypothetical protein
LKPVFGRLTSRARIVIFKLEIYISGQRNAFGKERPVDHSEGDRGMKKLLAWFLAGCLLLGLAPAALAEQADGMELTLPFAFGERTGRYTGTLSGGLPGGNGSFVYKNGEDVGWTYNGSWSGGHMEGYGVTVWEDGWRAEGLYSGDYLNGEGAEYNGNILWRKGSTFRTNGQRADLRRPRQPVF